jgi:REP element-mobilizing transposase RayT
MIAEEKDYSSLVIRRRNLPHWEMAGATYFVTFELNEGELSGEEIVFVKEHVKRGDPGFYRLLAMTVMPDHAHVLLQPNDGIPLPRIMKGMKGVSARMINERRGRRGALWRDESYDHIIRNDAELEKTLEYILNNAPKRGLCEDGWEYPGFYLRDD